MALLNQYGLSPSLTLEEILALALALKESERECEWSRVQYSRVSKTLVWIRKGEARVKKRRGSKTLGPTRGTNSRVTLTLVLPLENSEVNRTVWPLSFPSGGLEVLSDFYSDSFS